MLTAHTLAGAGSCPISGLVNKYFVLSGLHIPVKVMGAILTRWIDSHVDGRDRRAQSVSFVAAIDPLQQSGAYVCLFKLQAAGVTLQKKHCTKITLHDQQLPYMCVQDSLYTGHTSAHTFFLFPVRSYGKVLLR